MLGTTETTSGAEQKVLGVPWNFVSDQFVLVLTEIATLARNIESTKRNVVSVTAKFSSSETQGILVGTMRYFRASNIFGAKVYFKG